MDKVIKKVLMSIEVGGFEAFIVGGYVRDFLRGVKSTDIDICTNALPKDLKKLFPSGNAKNDEYGAFKIIVNKYNIDITSYRKEMKYEKRRPIEIEYVNDLKIDLLRRDFTINSLCMDKDEKIIDLLNGKEDIYRKEIKVIGDINQKLTEDPLRMLRAIRLGITLDFTIDPKIITFIKTHQHLIKTLSIPRKKHEINCILLSENAHFGLKYLKDLNLLDALEINYEELIIIDDINGMWAQMDVKNEMYFTKEEKAIKEKIKEILKLKKVDNYVIYKYGLYLATVVGKILNMNLKSINKASENLPIKTRRDIDITSTEIINILNIEPSVIIKDIYHELEIKILNNELVNQKNIIIEYLNNNRKKWI